jgi:hypothetical protein
VIGLAVLWCGAFVFCAWCNGRELAFDGGGNGAEGGVGRGGDGGGGDGGGDGDG